MTDVHQKGGRGGRPEVILAACSYPTSGTENRPRRALWPAAIYVYICKDRCIDRCIQGIISIESPYPNCVFLAYPQERKAARGGRRLQRYRFTREREGESEREKERQRASEREREHPDPNCMFLFNPQERQAASGGRGGRRLRRCRVRAARPLRRGGGRGPGPGDVFRVRVVA